MKCHVCRGSGAHAQLTTFFVVMLIPLSLLIALVVDLGGALAYRTWQGSLLESTRQSCFGEANAVKYADNPGEEARCEVLEMLRPTAIPERPRSTTSKPPRACVGPQTATQASMSSSRERGRRPSRGSPASMS